MEKIKYNLIREEELKKVKKGQTRAAVELSHSLKITIIRQTL